MGAWLRMEAVHGAPDESIYCVSAPTGASRSDAEVPTRQMRADVINADRYKTLPEIFSRLFSL